MDEEREEQGQEQQKQNMPEQLAKQGANMAKQEVVNATKKKAKETIGVKVAAFVAANALTLTIIVVIIAAVCFFSLVILPAIEDVIDQFLAEDVDEVTYQTVEEYCTIDEIGVHMDKDGFLKNIIANLALAGIDLNSLGFGDDGDYKVYGDSNTVSENGSTEAENGTTTGNDKKASTDNIINLDPDSEAAQYLYKYVTASLAGELPYIPGSDEETQGIIRIKRRKNANEEAKDLTYIGYEQFSQMLESTDDSVKQKIMNYFTLDKSWNLCVAKSYKKTVTHNGTITESEYTISEVKIPYRDMVSQYTVPFLFLIDLQLTTQNANYVEAVSELMTKQSEIEFTIFDSITTDTNEYTYKAKRNTRREETSEELAEDGVTMVEKTEMKTHTSDVEDKTVTVEEIDDIKANVTKAKTWIIEQETNYVMQQTKEYPYGEEGQTTDLPPEDPPTGEGSWDIERKEHYFEEIIKNEWVKSGDTKTQIKPSKFMGLWSNETGTYVKGASYKPNGKDKPGKIVEYNMLKSTQKDKPVMNIVTSKKELYDLLELRVTTQTHAELMKEIIEFYLSGEELEEDTFNKTAFTSMYEPSEFVDGTYDGDFDVHDESLFITDIDELIKAFKGGYSKSDRLVDNAQAFLDMQKTYKVNALFAASVSITETGAGRKGNAVNGCHNWFNMTGTDGPYRRVVNSKGEVHNWRIYENDAKGIEAFGIFISGAGKTQLYYPAGNYTVGTIGPVYCPETSAYPTQDEEWVESTLAQIARFYGAIGIDISPIVDGGGGDFAPGEPGEGMSDADFNALIKEALKHLGIPYVWGGTSPEKGFDCSGFVSWCINHSGVGNVGRLTANGLLKHCKQVSKSDAKPGDLIFFQGTYNTAGASHVGIYMGGGQMIHAGKPVQITSTETPYYQRHFLGFGRLP